MTDQDDGLEGYEPTIMRPMAKRNQRWSTPPRSRIYLILLPFALVGPVQDAITSNTNRGLNIFMAITFVWTGSLALIRRRKPLSPPKRPPAYMTWTAQRWWIGLAFVGALATVIVASVAYAHQPVDQAAVLIVGSVIGTGAMWLVRFIAKRRYAG